MNATDGYPYMLRQEREKEKEKETPKTCPKKIRTQINDNCQIARVFCMKKIRSSTMYNVFVGSSLLL